MAKQSLAITQPNEAWIVHREDVGTVRDGNCDVYVLLDAYSGFVFAQEVSKDLPAPSKIVGLLKTARAKTGCWPKRVLVLKKDPYVERLRTICDDLELKLLETTAGDLAPYVRPLKDAFRQFKMGHNGPEQDPLSAEEREELEAFVPETYSPCPCASGKKFKFCCQKIFKDITFAMCAAEEGRLDEALRHMKLAEAKVGRTAEVVCRYAICWSFFDRNKTKALLHEAIGINPLHPRLNYILGIESVAAKKYEDAIKFYRVAIENYPEGDKFHLNETYNNLGTAYFRLEQYRDAKEAWERGLVLFPLDRMVKRNLFTFIYGNPDIPQNLREISPFIERFLAKHAPHRAK